jgi:hypothetical protein
MVGPILKPLLFGLTNTVAFGDTRKGSRRPWVVSKDCNSRESERNNGQEEWLESLAQGPESARQKSSKRKVAPASPAFLRGLQRHSRSYGAKSR